MPPPPPTLSFFPGHTWVDMHEVKIASGVHFDGGSHICSDNNKAKYTVSLSGDTSSSLFLSLQKGDLILLDDANTGETVLTSGWCSGTCERTGDHGDFPADNVYVLPCVNRPPDDILVWN